MVPTYLKLFHCERESLSEHFRFHIFSSKRKLKEGVRGFVLEHLCVRRQLYSYLMNGISAEEMNDE